LELTGINLESTEFTMIFPLNSSKRKETYSPKRTFYTILMNLRKNNRLTNI